MTPKYVIWGRGKWHIGRMWNASKGIFHDTMCGKIPPSTQTTSSAKSVDLFNRCSSCFSKGRK